jgi:hypothetical protein
VRAGLVAKGIAYLVIAVIAIHVAVSGDGRPQSPDRALETVAHEPFDWALLALLAIGFAGYAVWRVAQAIFDLEREGRDLIVLGKPLGYFVDGLVHLGLGALAVVVLAGSGGSDSGSEQKVTAEPGRGCRARRRPAEARGPAVRALPARTVAVGLLATGLFCFVEARYRDV